MLYIFKSIVPIPRIGYGFTFLLQTVYDSGIDFCSVCSIWNGLSAQFYHGQKAELGATLSVIGGVLNIVLDWLFISVFQWGWQALRLQRVSDMHFLRWSASSGFV